MTQGRRQRTTAMVLSLLPSLLPSLSLSSHPFGQALPISNHLHPTDPIYKKPTALNSPSSEMPPDRQKLSYFSYFFSSSFPSLPFLPFPSLPYLLFPSPLISTNQKASYTVYHKSPPRTAPCPPTPHLKNASHPHTVAFPHQVTRVGMDAPPKVPHPFPRLARVSSLLMAIQRPRRVGTLSPPVLPFPCPSISLVQVLPPIIPGA